MRGKGIHSKSIFVQLIVFSLLTSLVPILIISIFLFYKLDNTAQTETKDYHEQITSQYMKNIGEKVYIKTFTAIEDTKKKEFLGELKSFDENSITIKLDDEELNKELVIDRKDIALIKKIYKWE